MLRPETGASGELAHGVFYPQRTDFVSAYIDLNFAGKKEFWLGVGRTVTRGRFIHSGWLVSGRSGDGTKVSSLGEVFLGSQLPRSGLHRACDP